MSDHYTSVISRAWRDAAFKARLLSDPTSALAEEGVDVPEGVELRVVEDSQTVRYLVIPPAPADLSSDDLSGVSGGPVDSESDYT